MLFSEIKPYIRNSRFMRIDSQTNYRCVYSYDSRFFYVFSGNGVIFANNKRYFLQQGDALIINSGIEYQIENPEDKVVYISYNFDYTYEHSDITTPVPPQLSTLYDKSKIIEKIHFEDMDFFNNIVFLQNFQHMKSKIVSIQNEHSKKILFHEIKESNLFSEILVEAARLINFTSSIAKNNVNTHKNSVGDTNTVDAIINYIHQFYFQKLTYEQISKEFSLHPNYISSLIKARTGFSLHKYILHTRISYALGLLESGDSSITQIAEECGFGDIQHFSHAFKSVTGKTPSNYKKGSS